MQAIQIFPGPGGAHNWAPMAFNPTTNLMYIPISANSSSSYRLPDTYTYTAGRTNMGVTFGGGFGGHRRRPAVRAVPRPHRVRLERLEQRREVLPNRAPLREPDL